MNSNAKNVKSNNVSIKKRRMPREQLVRRNASHVNRRKMQKELRERQLCKKMKRTVKKDKRRSMERK